MNGTPDLTAILTQLISLQAQMERLEASLLTGPPYRIAADAAALEADLANLPESIASLRQFLEQWGSGNLGAAIPALYRSAHPERGPQLERIGRSLRNLAHHSAAGLRRAQDLEAGLRRSIDGLRAQGISAGGQLLAEA